MANPLLPELHKFSALTDVPDEQLLWLLDRATDETFADGTVMFKPGDALDHFNLLLAGRVRLDGGPNGAGDEIMTFEPYSTMGVLPYSRLTKAASFGYAEGDVRWLGLHRDHLKPMTQTCYELTAALVQQMTNRVRSFTAQQQQTDKLASLGRLSAGLAHELNNPVAAVVRSATTLKDHLRATPDSFKALMHLNLTDAQVDAVNTTFFQIIDQKTSDAAQRLSLLERSSREDELTDWLDDRAVSEPDDELTLDLAGSLTEFGVTTDDLDALLEQIGDDNLPGVLKWIVDNMVTEQLVSDISEASKRIQNLVGSIKNYTHMDQGGGKQAVHLADGIRSTLTLLNHKLNAKKITVTLDFPTELPDIQGWPGELNQVWTNLIDNAADALPDTGGTLTIAAHYDPRPDSPGFVITTITDNGAGIPEAIRSKIFDPFFTTKAIGKGTGLGLDIVQGIVRHHNGLVKVESEPGQTVFSVCLPV